MVCIIMSIMDKCDHTSQLQCAKLYSMQFMNQLTWESVQQLELYISERFYWPKMKKEIERMAQSCIFCQKAKISRHNHPAIIKIPPPSEKFQSINMTWWDLSRATEDIYTSSQSLIDSLDGCQQHLLQTSMPAQWQMHSSQIGLESLVFLHL